MHHWEKLKRKPFGTYVEYLAKLHFIREGADIYIPEIDDKGIDFVVRQTDGTYLEIQTKARRALHYFFMPKSQFPMQANRFLFLGLFLDKANADGRYYLIPVTAWQSPNELFKSFDYAGKKSAPEWGLQFAKGKNLPLLERYWINPPNRPPV